MNEPRRLRTNQQFIEKAKSIHKNQYNYDLVEYTGSFCFVVIACPKHGNFKQKAYSHLAGHGCSHCMVEKNTIAQTSNKHDFINKAQNIHNVKSYDYSRVLYVNCKQKVEIICPTHGIFKQTPNKHLRGTGCPKCKLSKGALAIERFLRLKNIQYISEYTFSNCRNKNLLPFDFGVFKNNKLLGLIEYQGEQHYFPVRWKGAITIDKAAMLFKQNQERDIIKKDFCLKNNIPLLEISYTQLNTFESMLDEFLNKLSI